VSKHGGPRFFARYLKKKFELLTPEQRELLKPKPAAKGDAGSPACFPSDISASTSDSHQAIGDALAQGASTGLMGHTFLWTLRSGASGRTAISAGDRPAAGAFSSAPGKRGVSTRP
jgi:hypothetical protein